MITDPGTGEALAGRRRTVLVAGGLVLLALVAVIVGSMLASSDREPSPTPTPDLGLLQWEPRGGLADDAELIESAEGLWRRAIDFEGDTVVPPEGEVSVLWADRIGLGRVVVMQAIGADGQPYVAQASEHGDPAVLEVDTVEVLPDDAPIALAVTYDGNLRLGGLEPGVGSALIQLLPEPPESSEITALWHYESTFAHTGLERLETKTSGITETFLQLDKSDPDGTPIVMTTTVEARAGIAGTIGVRGGHLLPVPARIALVDDPRWGPSGRVLGEEYTALNLAALKLEMEEATGFVATTVEIDDFGQGVLASIVVLQDRDAGSRMACVVTDGGDHRDTVADAVLADPAVVDLAELRVLAALCPVIRGDDQRLVAVAVARPDAGEVVIAVGDRVLAGPGESLASVLDGQEAPDGLVARLSGDDGTGSSYPIAPDGGRLTS